MNPSVNMLKKDLKESKEEISIMQKEILARRLRIKHLREFISMLEKTLKKKGG